MSDSTLLDEVIDPFTKYFNDASAQKVMEFGIAPQMHEGVNELANRSSEGSFTASKRVNCEAVNNVAYFIDILKSKAKRRLALAAPSWATQGL